MKCNIRHSGQLGDIVYALPAMQALARRNGAARVSLYVPSDNVASYGPEMKHAGGGQMVSRALFDFIAPLLLAQSYVDAVHFVPSGEIPADAIDFDVIRGGGIHVLAGNLKDHYYKAFAVLADSPCRWLEPSAAVAAAPPDFDILIGRSMRYLNQAIDYGVLAPLGLRVGFVGLESEFDEFRARFPNLPMDHVPVANALDVCDRIASASLYIGNQSFFFAIAEALQTNRLLEVFEPIPNVVPSGGRCGQFLTTYGLRALVGTFFCRVVPARDGTDDLKSEYVKSV
jgi:hypothetical protein